MRGLAQYDASERSERSCVHCDRPSGSEGGAVSIKPSAAESRAQRKASAAVGGGGWGGGGEYIVYNCEYLVSLTCLVKVFGCAATPISTLGLRELTASRRLVGGEFEWV